MRKALNRATLALTIAAAVTIVAPNAAGAAPITETFFFGSGVNGWYIGGQNGSLPQSAFVNFDLVEADNVSALWSGFDFTDFASPSVDASGFAPGTSIGAGQLQFDFYSVDPDLELVTIRSTFFDGDALLFDQLWDLSSGTSSAFIPLVAAGYDLRPFIESDGGLLTAVFTVEPFGGPLPPLTDIDIALNSASLTVETVPEPATLLLLGTGLLGAGIVRRRVGRR